MLASAAEDGTINLWDAASRRLVATLEGHTGVIAALSFNSQGRVLASGSWDKTARLWDVDAQAPLWQFTAPKPVSAVAFLGNRQLAVGQVDGAIHAVEISTRSIIATLRGHDTYVSALKVAGTGAMASAARDGKVRLWKSPPRRGTEIVNPHFATVRGVAFSPDGNSIASTGMDSAVMVWDLQKNQKSVDIYGRLPSASSIAWSPSGHTIAVGCYDNIVRIWNVALVRGVDPKDVRKLHGGQEAAILKGHDGEVQSVAFSPVRNVLASASWDQTVKLWDLATSKTLFTLRHPGPVMAVAFSPRGETLVTGSKDKTVRLWNAADGAAKWQMTASGPVTQVAFSPDGTLLAASSLDTVTLWQVATRRKIAELRGHSGGERVAFAFSPNRKTFATAAADKTIRLWDLATLRQVLAISIPTRVVPCIAFSPDGRRLATCGDDGEWSVRVWNGATDTEVAATLNSR